MELVLKIYSTNYLNKLFHQHCMLISKMDKNLIVFLKIFDFFFLIKHHFKIYRNKIKILLWPTRNFMDNDININLVK